MFSLMDEREPFYVDHWKPAPSQPPNVRMEVGLVSHTAPSLPSIDPCSLALSHQLHHLNLPHPTAISPLPCSPSTHLVLSLPLCVLLHLSLWGTLSVVLPLHAMASSFPETFSLLHFSHSVPGSHVLLLRSLVTNFSNLDILISSITASTSSLVIDLLS